MKKNYPRNVRLDRPGLAATSARRRALERVLIANPYINRFLAESAKMFLTALIWPRFVAPYRLEFSRYPLALPALDPALCGYSILHLTDLHIGRTDPKYLRRTIDRCLSIRPAPDVVLITGDLIDYHPRSLEPARLLLNHLVQRAAAAGVKDGIFTIFGNHDYHEYSWRHIGPRSARRAIHKRLAAIVEEAGIHILRNQAVTIERGAAGREGPAARLTIVGLDEMWTGLADAAAAFKDVDPATPTILLQHNPDAVGALLEYPWHFMLAGHSHGGQARFPLLGPLYVPMEHREYLHGFFDFAPHPAHQHSAHSHPRRMFVSRGIGHTTPIRLRCPPEATLFTLCDATQAREQAG